jgi:mxaA protein
VSWAGRKHLRLCRRTLAAFLTLSSFACAAAEEPPESGVQPIVTLRDTGYLLGDLVDERIDVPLPAGYTLDPDSLPLPGRVAPWMEVRRARSETGSGQGREAIVTVTYQVFAEVEQASRVPIPQFKLRIRDGAQAQLVTVPERSFLLSPALPASLGDEDRELKPSPSPQPLPLSRIIGALAGAVLVALACAGYLLWAYDRLPFLPRSPGPFARAWRKWRWAGALVPRRPWMAESGRWAGARVRRAGTQVSRRPWMAERGPRTRPNGFLSDAEATVLLRDWHAALNQAAGETLYTSTLPRLFARAPHLVPLREQFERVFQRSWQAFYGVSMQGEPAPAEVLDLLRRAAERERGVPC